MDDYGDDDLELDELFAQFAGVRSVLMDLELAIAQRINEHYRTATGKS